MSRFPLNELRYSLFSEWLNRARSFSLGVVNTTFSLLFQHASNILLHHFRLSLSLVFSLRMTWRHENMNIGKEDGNTESWADALWILMWSLGASKLDIWVCVWGIKLLWIFCQSWSCCWWWCYCFMSSTVGWREKISPCPREISNCLSTFLHFNRG